MELTHVVALLGIAGSFCAFRAASIQAKDANAILKQRKLLEIDQIEADAASKVAKHDTSRDEDLEMRGLIHVDSSAKHNDLVNARDSAVRKVIIDVERIRNSWIFLQASAVIGMAAGIVGLFA